MTDRTKKLKRTYLTVWLVTWLLSFSTLIYQHDPDVSYMTGAGAGISSLFGPWTTFVAILFRGAYFNLWLAIGLTLAIGGIILLSIRINNKWVTILSVIAYIPLIILWTLSGWGQMVCCMR